MIGLNDEYYQVRRLRCPLSKIIAEERWETRDRLLHNPEGPALLKRDQTSSVVTHRSFWIDGGLHNDAGEPAYEDFDAETGACTYRLFIVDGSYSRPDGKPHAEYLDPKTGHVYRAEYRLDGERGPLLHRLDGPALLIFDRMTGEQIIAQFFRNGRKWTPKERSGPDFD